MTFFKTLFLSAIAAYRKAISPLFPPSCRFYPSCSQYAADAICAHGAGRGAIMALRRLTRCHPWHRGGYDPVPRVSSRDANCPGQNGKQIFGSGRMGASTK
ncbi:MAG: membrane protein insertion efficiency factor YidD [Candidatus Krumholzibacteria bacterium]|nr:membrane protein insertion efficiency factor YidD [Candidatus Krumholzibacteria bacterium]